MFTTTLFLESAIGGVVKAAASKGLDGTAAALAKNKYDDRREPVAVQAAADEVIRHAIQAIRDQHFDPSTSELSLDVVRLLDHPPFAGEVARALIFRGGADLDRLREVYLNRADDDDQVNASERWKALEGPLDDLIVEIETRLLSHPLVGPPLRDAQKLRRLARIDETDLELLDATRVLTDFARANVEAVKSNGGLLQAMRAILGDIANSLSDLPAIIRALETRREAAPKTSNETSHPTSLTSTEAAYLRELRERCNRVPLAQDGREDPRKRDRQSPQLDRVYVDLATKDGPDTALILDRAGVPEADRKRATERLDAWWIKMGGDGRGSREGIEHASRNRKKHPLAPWLEDAGRQRDALAPMSALEALARKGRMVLLGDPGSGKSTLVNHLTYLLATERLGETNTSDSPLPSTLRGSFPIRIEMRKWHADLLKDKSAAGKKGRKLVYFALEALDPKIDSKRWLRRLDDQATIVLFDGLDEVPEHLGDEEDKRVNPRRDLADAVRAFCTAHDRCRVLVTCRVRPYRDRTDYQLTNLPDFRLAALDPPKIARFCAQWYDELGRVSDRPTAELRTKHKRLTDALAERPVLADMAGSPLLLTMLAHINVDKPLPRDRAALYQQCTHQLLWEWERQKADEAGSASLLDLLDKTSGKVDTVRVERTIWRLTFESYAAGEQDRDLTVTSLRDALAAIHPHQHQGFAWASRVVGLISDRCGLLLDLDDSRLAFPHKSFREYFAARWLAVQRDVDTLAAKLAKADDRWHEVIELACGQLRLDAHDRAVRDVLRRLTKLRIPSGSKAWEWTLLAGRVWRDHGPSDLDDRPLERRIESILYKAMTKPTLDAKQRCEAGFILADAGVVPKDLDQVITIAATETLGYEFQIGKYPVTNYQYRAFVNAGGYDRSHDWWSDEAVSAIMKFQKTFADGQWPKAPRYWHQRSHNRATQPVTGISWFEAMAYCAWLTQRWLAEGSIDGQAAVRLPTEPEWGLTAAGTEGRAYPWGEEPDPSRLNHKGTDLGHPTPVQMHPRGATPADGIFDLCGNVWEWTLTKKENLFVLAGGTYYMDEKRLSSSARGRGDPGDWSDIGGFRVVVVPASRASS